MKNGIAASYAVMNFYFYGAIPQGAALFLHYLD